MIFSKLLSALGNVMSYVVNAPLDANKLKDSLVKLIDRDGGWRKLGARLCQNVSLTLEPLDGAKLI